MNLTPRVERFITNPTVLTLSFVVGISLYAKGVGEIVNNSYGSDKLWWGVGQAAVGLMGLGLTAAGMWRLEGGSSAEQEEIAQRPPVSQGCGAEAVDAAYRESTIKGGALVECGPCGASCQVVLPRSEGLFDRVSVVPEDTCTSQQSPYYGMTAAEKAAAYYGNQPAQES